MAELNCGWCGNNCDQVEKLVTGDFACICNVCIVMCVALGATESVPLPDTFVADEKLIRCSFCDEKTIRPSSITMMGGSQICRACLDACLEVIAPDFSAPLPDGKTLKDFWAVSYNMTSKDIEWFAIVRDAKNDQQLLREGRIWLRKNMLDPAAGEAFVCLLRTKPTAALIAQANRWLAQYPEHSSHLSLTAALYEAVPSTSIAKIAAKNFDQTANIDQLSPLIDAILGGQYRPSLFNKIEQLLYENPEDQAWTLIFSNSSKYSGSARNKLFLRWMQLNKHNPNFDFVSCSPLTSSPEVVQLALLWMKGGGHTSAKLPRTLSFLLRISNSLDPAVAKQVQRFARAWSKANPDNSSVGHVHATLVSITQSKSDSAKAKQWLEDHRSHLDTWQVVAGLLEISIASMRPDQFAVKEAKSMLANSSRLSQNSRLVNALVQAWPDRQTIDWAKQLCAQGNHPRTCSLLLELDPDSDSM